MTGAYWSDLADELAGQEMTVCPVEGLPSDLDLPRIEEWFEHYRDAVDAACWRWIHDQQWPQMNYAVAWQVRCRCHWGWRLAALMIEAEWEGTENPRRLAVLKWLLVTSWARAGAQSTAAAIRDAAAQRGEIDPPTEGLPPGWAQ